MYDLVDYNHMAFFLFIKVNIYNYMVKNTKKNIKCAIVKQSKPKISVKNMKIHKKYLGCMNTKCKKFLDKEIKINETCLDKTKHLNLHDEKRADCFMGNNASKNFDDQMNCRNTKCLIELNKYNKIPKKQQKIDASEFSFYDKEKKRLRDKEFQIYPVLEKISNLYKDIDSLEYTMSKCKDESEKNKLNNKRLKLLKMLAKIQST